MLKYNFLKWAIFGVVLVILALTVLEFPAPIGFETRPQDNVSLVWLVFFLVILIVEITTLFLVFKKPYLGGIFGIATAIFNILQVIADQAHLMQPEVASFGYMLLEDVVVIFSVVLAYFSLRIIKLSKI